MEQICKTCGHSHTLNYCNKCGQKVISKRFTTKELLHELFHNLIHVDRGFFYTIYSLLVRPHVVIKEYLNGATRKYTNPAKFAILLIALVTFFIIRSQFLDNNMKEINNMVGIDNPKSLEFQKSFIELIKHNLQYFTLLILPFLAISSRWLYKSFNFAEHLILHCYIYGLLTLLTLPFSFFVVQHPTLRLINFSVIIIFYTFVIQKLFNNNLFISFIKSLTFYIIGYFLFVLSFVIITLSYLYANKLIIGHAF